MVLGYPEHGVRHREPSADFAAWATACGGYGVKVDRPEGVRAAIERGAGASTGPALVDVDVDPNEPPLPGKVEYEQAKKFAEAFLRGQPHKAAIATTLFKRQDRAAQGLNGHGGCPRQAAAAGGDRRRRRQRRCERALRRAGGRRGPVRRRQPRRRTPPTARTTGRCRSAWSSRAPWTTAVAAVAVCRRARRAGAVPWRRDQPGRAVLQRGGGARLVQVLPPAGVGRRRGEDLRRRAGHRARRAQRRGWRRTA